MASVSNIVLSIVRDVANANVTVTYDINWSNFDQLTNLPYTESVRLIGDDSGQDGDNLPAGDDLILVGAFPLNPSVSSNGQAVTARTKNFTFAFSSLNEDFLLATLADIDDEIRALVTLSPRLPIAVSAESNVVVVDA